MVAYCLSCDIRLLYKVYIFERICDCIHHSRSRILALQYSEKGVKNLTIPRVCKDYNAVSLPSQEKSQTNLSHNLILSLVKVTLLQNK